MIINIPVKWIKKLKWQNNKLRVVPKREKEIRVMKKKIIILLSACFLISSEPYLVCAQQEISETITLDDQVFKNSDDLWNYLEQKYPRVTTKDIETGNYSEQYVIIYSIARNVDVQPSIEFVDCDMYYNSADNEYTLDNLWCTFFGSEDLKKNGYVSGGDYLPSMENNDIIEGCYYINYDNSYGGSNMLAIRKVGEDDGSAKLHETIHLTFHNSVPNDVTGNWRLATTRTDQYITDYALNYYNNYFKASNEIHGIINFADNTTSCLSIVGGELNVAVHQYIAGEENDAKILFGGSVIAQYYINLTTGEVTVV